MNTKDGAGEIKSAQLLITWYNFWTIKGKANRYILTYNETYMCFWK